jgi:hypothetical protein
MSDGRAPATHLRSARQGRKSHREAKEIGRDATNDRGSESGPIRDPLECSFGASGTRL